MLMTVCCASPVMSGDPPADIARRQELSRVVIADGISREEAEAIASFYFHDHVSVGCGAVGNIEDGGVSWRFPALFGYAGARDGKIVVNKISGSVEWDGHPAVHDPLSMLPSEPSVQKGTRNGVD